MNEFSVIVSALWTLSPYCHGTCSVFFLTPILIPLFRQNLCPLLLPGNKLQSTWSLNTVFRMILVQVPTFLFENGT